MKLKRNFEMFFHLRYNFFFFYTLFFLVFLLLRVPNDEWMNMCWTIKLKDCLRLEEKFVASFALFFLCDNNKTGRVKDNFFKFLYNFREIQLINGWLNRIKTKQQKTPKKLCCVNFKLSSILINTLACF